MPPPAVRQGPLPLFPQPPQVCIQSSGRASGVHATQDPLRFQAHLPLLGGGRHLHQRLRGLPRPAESRPDTQETPQASQEAPELCHGCSGQRVRIDVKYLPLLHMKGRPEPRRQYLYNAIDDCTRLQVALVNSQIMPQASVHFLRLIKRSFPFSTPGNPDRPRHGVHLCLLSPRAEVTSPSSEPWGPWASGTSSSRWVGPSTTARWSALTASSTRSASIPGPLASPGTQGAGHQALDQLLQLPAPTIRSTVEQTSPQATLLRYLLGCHPCLKSVHCPLFAYHWIITKSNTESCGITFN